MGDLRDVSASGCIADAVVIENSAVYGSQRMTVDGCVCLRLESQLHETQDVLRGAPEWVDVDTTADGIIRLGQLGDFFGLERDDFLSKCVARELQDDPGVWSLGVAALTSLGSYPFADQPRLLAKLAQRCRASASSEGKPS